MSTKFHNRLLPIPAQVCAPDVEASLRADLSGNVLRPSLEVVVKRLGEEMIVVDVATTPIYELNETATRIGEVIGEDVDVPDNAHQLPNNFGVSPIEARDEATALLASQSFGVVVPCYGDLLWLSRRQELTASKLGSLSLSRCECGRTSTRPH